MIPLTTQHIQPKTDIAIAQECRMQPIQEIAQKLGISPEYLYQYGPYKAKVTFPFLDRIANAPSGKLILVTGISPTKAGEGKTTTTVGLGDALMQIGKKAAICLREPSLGPCFGMKGGAAGGGYAQVVPMEEINLHFTGDFHAIGAAHNLLSAMIENHLYWGNELKIDPKRIVWRRVMDMNDRSLRKIAFSFNNKTNEYMREGGFDITVASEVMAIFCLARNLADLQNRIGNILVAYTTEMKPVYARDLHAAGAMTALLKDALQPNIVQTLEGTPAFIHGGPFANIAHGCNSLIATHTALKTAEYVVTEAGFGADLGAEKFFDIKCRKAGFTPDCVVIVATIRALKMHGGVAKNEYKNENLTALENGFSNLERHILNTRKFGVPVVVALNRFSSDTQNEFNLLKQLCNALNAPLIDCDHWAQGGAGCAELAHTVVETIATQPSNFKFLYDDSLPLIEKVRTIVQELYGAQDIDLNENVLSEIDYLQQNGYGHYPVCIAKTPLSFSTDPALFGAPVNHIVPIKEVRLARGAEFVVILCGDVMTMPGLPRIPSANNITVNADNKIEGLF